jgi:hypothetical protein
MIVTWFVDGQAPSIAQTSFTTLTRCEAARRTVLDAGVIARFQRSVQNTEDAQDARRSLAEAKARRQDVGSLREPTPEQERKLRGVALPNVAAVCVKI